VQTDVAPAESDLKSAGLAEIELPLGRAIAESLRDAPQAASADPFFGLEVDLDRE
jgi:hypothetical protein